MFFGLTPANSGVVTNFGDAQPRVAVLFKEYGPVARLFLFVPRSHVHISPPRKKNQNALTAETKWATIVIGILFAAGHIPTMIASGASAGEFAKLFLDAALRCGYHFGTLPLSKDIVWFALVLLLPRHDPILEHNAGPLTGRRVIQG